MEININLEDKVEIKWRRETTNGVEDDIIHEVGIDDNENLRCRVINLSKRKDGDTDWKHNESEAVRLITGMKNASKRLILAIFDELIEEETLPECDRLVGTYSDDDDDDDDIDYSVFTEAEHKMMVDDPIGFLDTYFQKKRENAINRGKDIL